MCLKVYNCNILTPVLLYGLRGVLYIWCGFSAQFQEHIFSFFSPDGHCSLADNWNTANLLCLLLQQPHNAFRTEYRVPQITNRCLKSNKSVSKQLLLEALTQVSSCAVGPDARQGVSLDMLRDRKTCRLWDLCHNDCWLLSSRYWLGLILFFLFVFI